MKTSVKEILRKMWRRLIDLHEIELPSTLFVLMFLVFLLQIVVRYFFRPIVWTQEFVMICYLWVVLFSASWAVRRREIVSFGLVYDLMPPRVQKIFDFIGHLLIVVTFSAIFIPSAKYIIFINFLRTPALRIRSSIVYFPYLIFLASMIIRYTYRLVKIFTHKEEQ